MLRHLIHFSLPAILSSLETVITFQTLQSLSVKFSPTGLPCRRSRLTRSFIRLAEFNICETDRVIEIELRGKVPSTVICIFSTNEVGVESQKSLIRRHSRGAGI